MCNYKFLFARSIELDAANDCINCIFLLTMMIIDIHNFTVRSVAVFSTSTRHAGDIGSIVGPGMIYFRCTNLALYIRDCESLCLSDDTLKAVGPFYLVSMPGEVKEPDL